MSVPAPADTPLDPDDVLALFMLRVDSGEPVDRERFIAEHPSCAAALRDYFAQCDSLARLTGGDEAPAGPPAAEGGRPQIGGYEILQEVGRGATGVVYKARHPGLNRLVALKLVPAGGAHPERFRREIEAAGRLDHPHIVPVYEVGVDGGQPFLVMKWYDAGTLRGARARFAGRPRNCARVVAAVARAVHHAHQRGVLHRDVKPSNVLLDADGGPAVGDFGLAKWFGPGAPIGQDITRPGVVFGTPGYMAPEQAAGVAEVTTAADVYGLGGVLYELLTGRPPYPADTPLASLWQMTRGALVRPRAVDPTVPADLEAVCLKCLEHEPQRRYGTAADVADDLDRYLAGGPTVARPAGLPGRVRKWARRNPGIALLMALTAGVTVAGLVGILAQWRRATAALQAVEDVRRTEAEQAARVRETRAAHDVSLAGHEWRAGRIDRAEELLDGCPPEYRAWEWYYLKRLCRPPARPLLATAGEALAVAASPDGRLLAAGEDRAIRVWAAGNGAELCTLNGHAGRVTGLAFLPAAGGDAPRLVSSSADGSVKVWDLRAGAVAAEVRGHGGAVVAVAAAPDGSLVASVGVDRAVRIWNPGDGAGRLALPPQSEAVTALAVGRAYNGRGLRLVTGTADGTVRLWDPSTGQPLTTLPGHITVVRGMTFSASGQLLATASGDQTVRVINATNGKLVSVLVGHDRDVAAVAFNPDGRYTATGGRDGSVRIWATHTGRELFAFRGHRNAVTGIAFHPDGKRVASAGRDGRVLVWDARERQDAQAFGNTPADADNVAISPDASRVASGGPDGLVRVWDSRKANWSPPILSLKGHAGRVSAVAFSPDGARLASAGTDGTVRAWDSESGAAKFTFVAHQGGVKAVAFSPDGLRLATTGADGAVRVWSADTGGALRTLPGHPGGASCVAFSADGQLLAGGGADATVRVWQWEGGRELHALRGHGGPIWGVAFAPDGRRLATTAADRAVRVWDADDGSQVVSARCHGSDVMYGVAFSPDGRRLAVGCSDRGVKLFDPATGREVTSIAGHSDEVRVVAFSRDGTGLVSCGSHGELRLWLADPLP